MASFGLARWLTPQPLLDLELDFRGGQPAVMKHSKDTRGWVLVPRSPLDTSHFFMTSGSLLENIKQNEDLLTEGARN